MGRYDGEDVDQRMIDSANSFSGLVGSRGAEYDAELRRQRRGPSWPRPTPDTSDEMGLTDYQPGPVAVQRLIREAMEASGGREQEVFLEVKVRIPYFGKPEHGWRTALLLIRILRENWPAAQVIGAGGIELISDNSDDDSDDDSETWHVIDWNVEIRLHRDQDARGRRVHAPVVPLERQEVQHPPSQHQAPRPGRLAPQPPLVVRQKARRRFFKANHPPWICPECSVEMAKKEVTVHHKDEDLSNFHPSNLVGMHRKCHNRMHQLGKKFSAEHRKNLSLAHKGQVPWNKGKRKVRS